MRDPSVVQSMSVDEYLRFEETSPLKHEYVAGEVYAMSGVTLRHNRITLNVGTRLFAAAGDGPCRTFISDVRLQAASDVHYYPDVMVVCTPVAELDIIVREPCAVVEVTSPSTARVDRGEKLAAYRGMRSLRAYLIVDDRRRRVEQHSCNAAGGWLREEVVGEGRVLVPCLDVELTLDEVYRGVELPVVGEPEVAEYEA